MSWIANCLNTNYLKSLEGKQMQIVNILVDSNLKATINNSN